MNISIITSVLKHLSGRHDQLRHAGSEDSYRMAKAGGLRVLSHVFRKYTSEDAGKWLTDRVEVYPSIPNADLPGKMLNDLEVALSAEAAYRRMYHPDEEELNLPDTRTLIEDLSSTTGWSANTISTSYERVRAAHGLASLVNERPTLDYLEELM